MCACVFIEGEVKGMYRHDGVGGGGGEGPSTAAHCHLTKPFRCA